MTARTVRRVRAIDGDDDAVMRARAFAVTSSSTASAGRREG